MTNEPIAPAPNIVITGGTGLVGRKLAPMLLAHGFTVTILTRQLPKQSPVQGLSYALWNPAAQTIDERAIVNAHAIVNLAGAGVMDMPWTDAYKKEISDSRVQSAELLVRVLQNTPNTVKTVVSSSAIGWYGAYNGGPAFVETDPSAVGFLGETCQQWEQAISPVTAQKKRLVVLRTGIVLSKAGGALAEFSKPLQFRVAGILGNGKQIVSWIHEADLCNMIIYAIQQPKLAGIYNAVAPMPVSNKALNIALAKAMYGRGFLSLPVPSAALKIMLGERSIEILKSSKISAQKILNEGFQFQYPNIEAAVQSLV